MFEVKTVNYNLKLIPQKADAYLSDLFFILYFLYIANKKKKTIDKAGLQKGIAYIFEKLNNKNKADKIKVFNLPLYRYKHGDYNKSIDDVYANKLSKNDLLEIDGVNYKLTNKAIELIQDFDKSEENEDKKIVDSIIKEYIDKNIGFSFSRVRLWSHSRKVLNNDNETTVDKLTNDERKAIAYNASPQKVNFDKFKKGRKATIFPTQYLLKLNSLFEEAEMAINPIEPAEQNTILSELLHSKTNNQGDAIR
ncbi:hypothetical protein CL633_02975 [bacterium]|nr:hypothetical protein [bacterium]|tara:strand:- start:1048 stop:1800 length:753 start_codon:yes stop_codon:yes gene_type:complete